MLSNIPTTHAKKKHYDRVFAKYCYKFANFNRTKTY